MYYRVAYGLSVLLSKQGSHMAMCTLPVPFWSTSKSHRDKYFVSSSTQDLWSPKQMIQAAMDSEIREATLHVFPVFCGGLTHQNEQRPSKCAVPAAEETAGSVKHVAHHNGIMLSTILEDWHQRSQNSKNAP